MEHQLKKIIELCTKLYDRGHFREAWEGFHEAYQHTQDEYIIELLLEYFYYPNKDTYKKRYQENKAVLLNSKKVYGSDFLRSLNSEECEEIILCRDTNVVYYLKGTDIKQQILNRTLMEDTDQKKMYTDVLPLCLPQNSKCSPFLYYTAETLNVYLQIIDFQEAVKKSEGIFVEKGIEEYIKDNRNINIHTVCGLNIGSVCERLCEARKKFLYPQFQKTYGSLYDGYTFYVIRMGQTTSSLGPLMLWVLKQLKLIEEKGKHFIPVIDLSQFGNVFLEIEEIEKINPWEYYFEQPTHFSLQAVYHAQNVILGNADVNVNLDEMIDDSELLKEYIRLYDQYIHINKRIEKKAYSIYKSIIKPEWKVLGVVYRGTDYRNRPVPNEYRQPGMEELLVKTEQLIHEWGCDHIFLATEDKGAVEAFKQTFQDRVVYTDKERYDSAVVCTQEHSFNREFDRYLKGEEYLTEIYILSKCNCLLSGKVGILAAALPMNAGKYENKYIYDLGIYTEEDYMHKD